MWIEELVLDSEYDEPGTVFCSGFDEQIVFVAFYGAWGNEEFFGNFFGGELATNAVQYFFLAAGNGIEAKAGTRGVSGDLAAHDFDVLGREVVPLGVYGFDNLLELFGRCAFGQKRIDAVAQHKADELLLIVR